MYVVRPAMPPGCLSLVWVWAFQGSAASRLCMVLIRVGGAPLVTTLIFAVSFLACPNGRQCAALEAEGRAVAGVMHVFVCVRVSAASTARI